MGNGVRAAALAAGYIAAETALALAHPASPGARWASALLLFGAIPWGFGALGRRLGLGVRAAMAAVAAPAAFLGVLMLPLLAIESLSRQRTPGAGGTLHVALTGALILGGLVGTQAAFALLGWERAGGASPPLRALSAAADARAGVGRDGQEQQQRRRRREAARAQGHGAEVP